MPTATIPENGYLAGNFGPVDREVTAFNLRVEGRIPVELEGRYLRNGPNPAVAPDPQTYHWFTGDGMVHGLRLRGGKAEWYRNRWVRSQRLALQRGEEPPAGPVNGGMTGGPNTNVGGFAGRTWAMVEAGAFPTELTYELDTVAANDFFGTLPGAFSAHPKYDPATGELHAMTYSWGQWLDHVQYVVVGREGRVTKTLDIPLPGMTMLHDMGLTPNWALVLDQPVLVDLDLAFAGRFPFRWNDDYQGRVGLLPRTATSATDIVWCDISPCYTFHPLNSFETADGLVVMTPSVTRPWSAATCSVRARRRGHSSAGRSTRSPDGARTSASRTAVRSSPATTRGSGCTSIGTATARRSVMGSSRATS